MSTKPHIVTIQLLEKTYPIQCTPQEAPDLQLAASQLNQRLWQIRQSHKQLSQEQVMIAAALNLNYELLQLQKNKSPGSTEQLAGLNQLLDKALAE